MAKVQGTCEDRFKEVETLFQSYLDNGEELGASIVVNINGKNVVDVWGGHANVDHSRAWEENTITNTWSTTKTVTSLAALVLIDRGLLDPYEKVCTYWPEFAANGKENIEVRHILSHSSGVSGWATPLTVDDICDREASTALLAAQEPWWEPGTAWGYHSTTMGHLVGEVVRRVSGKTLKRFIAEDLCAPLGADFQLGAHENDWGRAADIVPPPADPAMLPDAIRDPTSITFRTLTNPPMSAEFANGPLWRGAEVGAANGFSNARGVARLLSAVTLGPKLDVPLLSDKTVDLVFKEQARGPDKVMGTDLRIGIGYGLTGKDGFLDWLPEGKVCTWGGWGGSMVVMDVDRGVTFAYVMNKMEAVGLGNDRTKAYFKAVYEALGVE